MYKLGWMPDGQTEEPFVYPNVWAKEQTSGGERLAIAPRSGYVNLLEDLTSSFEEPFQLLYVLVVPRSEASPGRYQSEFSFDTSQLKSFLALYSDFLEQDARHNLWIRPVSGQGLLVYDRHNVIYAYGPVESFIATLTSAGLDESSAVGLPATVHVHHYHQEFDDAANRLLTQDKWIESPLRPGDENPC